MSPFSQWHTHPEWLAESRAVHPAASGAGPVVGPLRRMLLAVLGVLALLLALAVGAPTASAADPCAPRDQRHRVREQLARETRRATGR